MAALVTPVLNKFEDLLKRGVICFIDDSEDQNSALAILVDQLKEEGKIAESQAFYSALLQREKVVSTGIGMGIALPHAKMDGIENFFIGIGIVGGEGIPWDSIDGLNVRLILLIGGPDGKHKEYLNNLREITQFLKEEERRDALIHAKSVEDVVKIFETC